MEECIFCQIANGKRDAEIIYSDEKVIAFMDHRPIGTGHILVLPREHYRDVFEIPDDILCRVSVIAKKLSIALKRTFNPLGINLIENNGTDAGQTIFHFHIHIIPRYDSRYNNELAKVAWGRKVVSPDVLRETREKIQKNLEIEK
ncbi:MAG: HIT family protein [Thermoplasmata archaeon]